MNAERKFLFACLIFALVIYAIHAFGLFDLLTDLPHLQTLIRQSGFFGYSLYILLFIIATLLLLPGSILVIAGGIVFGPLLGTLLSLIAATLASSCSFLLARWLPLVRLDLGGTLVLVVLLALSAPTLAGLIFMGERLHGMVNDWKNKKARKHV